MAQVLTSADIDQTILLEKPVAVLGYGSQGRAQALNLRDSGVDVRVGLRDGAPSAERARDDGMRVVDVPTAVAEATLVAMLIPDTAAPAVFREWVAPDLARGDAVLFAHGFNVHYSTVDIPATVDVIMVAPKAPGHAVRTTFADGHGVPCLTAVSQDFTGQATELANAYADAIGGGRAGILATTFAEETETDLFGEQSVLVGGVTGLIRTAFEVLVDAGYQPESAYFECAHELKLVVDLIYEHGLAGMYRFISDTAEFGDYHTANRPVWSQVRAHFTGLLQEIQDGRFARTWIAEDESGRAMFLAARKAAAGHPIEEVGERLRGLTR
ncbi:ketol-acid reductoisomerase [Amycolatopsis sp. RM579]|uniref:Ketol-acid reductoisomerase (NADP(+)) n=2 Tax=Amycolatopsis pithecellobii TaxID=664692 RepID=A0A6N7YVX4_9PSEU|nr:ketol-acid reductoisomerase [Amycolatopsis pithecellobii]MTD56058.1 ketol-acid reductoisomerase [Amycolatopsis pithecellobii]